MGLRRTTDGKWHVVRIHRHDQWENIGSAAHCPHHDGFKCACRGDGRRRDGTWVLVWGSCHHAWLLQRRGAAAPTRVLPVGGGYFLLLFDYSINRDATHGVCGERVRAGCVEEGGAGTRYSLSGSFSYATPWSTDAPRRYPTLVAAAARMMVSVTSIDARSGGDGDVRLTR